MALPTGADLKTYLRIEHSAEDTLLADLILQATAWAQSLVGRPFVAVAKTIGVDNRDAGVFYLGEYPVKASSPAPVITDSSGDVVDAATYALDPSTGRFTANTGSSWGVSPYQVVATVGLSAHPNYATKYEPQLRALIIGLAAVLYHHRNPGASSESSGGVSVSYHDAEVPPQLLSIARSMRMVRA